MNRREQIDELRDVFDKWALPQFSHEPVENQVMRALLHANACVEDQRLVLRGEAPIRPLTDYPQ